MSVNVCLRKEVVDHSEFEPGIEGKSHARLSGIALSQSEGQFYIGLDSLASKIPGMFAELVSEISFREVFPSVPRRVLGTYQEGGITADLDAYGPDKYEVKIRGSAEQMPAMLDLYRKIRAGTIEPEPDKDWDSSTSAEVLQRQLAAVQSELADKARKLDEIQRKLNLERRKSTYFEEALELIRVICAGRKWIPGIIRKIRLFIFVQAVLRQTDFDSDLPAL